MIIWMGFIFYNSSQTATNSLGMTYYITDFLKSIFGNSIDFESDLFITLIRKAAHLTEYFILGILVSKTARYNFSSIKNRLLWSFLFCMFYAASDEVHQLFVDGRSFMITDIIIDSFGAGLALLLFRKQ
ncbi:MAG: VanZ family protein [Clostridia bacterium]|nr:VanZ family protein [Clostridia bacterium]